MTLIFIRSEDHLEGNSNFKTWKARILNILEEHDLDTYLSAMVEELATNAWRVNFKKNQAKAKHIINDLVKDNPMFVIIPMKTAKEYFDTLTSLYEKKSPSKKRDLKNKI